MIQNITPYSYYNVCVYMLLIFPRPASAWITCEPLSLAFVPRLFVFSKLFSPSFAPACV